MASSNMEDCYFFIDAPDTPKARVRPMCLECHAKLPEQKCMFWAGSKNGYGPFTFKCAICDKIIYDEKNKTSVQNDKQ